MITIAGWRCAASFLSGVVFYLLATAPLSARADPAHKIVHTDRGPVRGITTPSVFKFLGIPYAAAPQGDLRFRPPQLHGRWRTPLDGTAFGNACPQAASLTNFGAASVNEDCLFLNVYVPRGEEGDAAEEGEGRPVMVFIHGGGLIEGLSNPYDPGRLAVQGGVVVVTINYRLGILGFLTHPALTAESSDHVSGNYGLLDQQFALWWVQRNIARFGGDPDNVTLFGESAGGLSVHANLASPSAAGLFHKAIVESGAYSLTQPTLAAAEALGTSVASLAGCGSQTAACLRSLPVTTILAVQAAAVPSMVPTADGVVLPQSIGAAFASGQFNRVPVIEGSNHDEWRLFVAITEIQTGAPLSAAGYVPAIAATLGVSPSVAGFLGTFVYPLGAYPPPATAPSIALGALGTDATFACNARQVSSLLAAHVPAYQYEFNDSTAPVPPGVSLSFPGGSYHSAELQYLFEFTGYPQSEDQRRLSGAMIGYWTRFARTGNPNGGAAPAWPGYGAGDQFQSLEAPTVATKGGFSADHKCAVWGRP